MWALGVTIPALRVSSYLHSMVPTLIVLRAFGFDGEVSVECRPPALLSEQEYGMVPPSQNYDNI